MELEPQTIIILVVILVLVIYNMIMIGVYASSNEVVKSLKEKLELQKTAVKTKYNIA